MNNKDYPLSPLREKLNASQKVVIVLNQRPSLDQVAAALSLKLAFKEAAKEASIVCASPMMVEFNHLVGINQVESRVTGTDLIISFNYSPDQVEKVSYNDDGNRPNIIVQPKAGAPSISEKLASFSYGGVGADIIISLGVKDPAMVNINGLNLSQGFVVNVDNSPANVGFGELSILDQSTPSLSEMALGIILGLNLALSPDAAQNILAGIWQSTLGMNNPNLGPDTYEAVAICLRAGAQKPMTNNIAPRRPAVFVPPQERTDKQQTPVEKPKEKEELPVKPPADWFEPKIFRGTNVS